MSQQHQYIKRRDTIRCVPFRFILFLWLSLVGIGAVAQSPTDSALLYDGLNGEVVHIALDGTVLSQEPLGLPVGATPPQQIAVTSDGTGLILAYVALANPSSLIIEDRPTGGVITHPLPPDMTADSLSFVASDAVFTDDGGQFAFAYARADGSWTVTLYERTAGWGAVAALDSRATIPDMSPVDVVGRTPIVQSVTDDGTVTLILAEPFSGYAANFSEVFTWNTLTGELIRLDGATTIDGDRFADGRVTALFDETLPNQAASFAYPQANTLTLTLPNGSRQTLFNTANLSLFWPRYVNGGEQILVGGYSAQNRLSWFILSAVDGSFMGDYPPVQMTGVEGTSDGFVYTVDAGANGGTLLYSVSIDMNGAGQPEERWLGPAGVSYRVIWTG
jgi:hypothetical protein